MIFLLFGIVMRRQLFTIFLFGFLALSFTTVCQTLVTEIPVKAAVADFQCYAQRDSVLIVFLEEIPSSNEYERHAYWLQGNRLDSAALDVLENRFLSGTSRAKGEQYYYFVAEKEKHKSLMAFTDAKPDSVFEVLSSDNLKHDLLTIINDNNLFIVVYNPDNLELKVQEVNGNRIVRERVYKTPYNLSYFYSASFAVFQPAYLPTVAGGSAEFKIYKRGDKILMTIDEPKFGKTSRTEILTFDLANSGEPKVNVIGAPTRELFRTYLDNDTLYRAFISRKSVGIQAIDLASGKAFSTIQINVRDEVAGKTQVSTRLGHLATLHRNDNLSSFMQTAGNFFPSIVKYGAMDGGREIVVGSYIFSENTGAGTGGLGLGRMIGYQHPATFSASAEPEGISRYFHLMRNSGSFTIDSSENTSVADRIDSYELAQSTSQKVEFGSKTYINLKNEVIGIYYLPQFRKITIVSYQK